jgi:hypothetical protein
LVAKCGIRRIIRLTSGANHDIATI